MRLGWRSPRANMLKGPDAEVLKGVFGDLQRFQTWPHVGLVRTTNQDLTGVVGPILWTVKSAAASPFVEGDPYSLFTGASAALGQIQVPRDFTTWLAFGAVGASFSSGAANSVKTIVWRVNAVNTPFVDQPNRAVVGATNGSVPFMYPVKKGDTIDVGVASSDATVDLTAAEMWLVFLPLT